MFIHIKDKTHKILRNKPDKRDIAPMWRKLENLIEEYKISGELGQGAVLYVLSVAV